MSLADRELPFPQTVGNMPEIRNDKGHAFTSQSI
jgi:hypothetical protein